MKSEKSEENSNEYEIPTSPRALKMAQKYLKDNESVIAKMYAGKHILIVDSDLAGVADETEKGKTKLWRLALTKYTDEIPDNCYVILAD